MKQFTQWKQFFTLLGMSLLSVVAIFPYVLSLQGELLKTIGQPIVIVVIAQLVQSAILFSVAIFFGLLLSNAIDFHLPLLDAILKNGNYKPIVERILGRSMSIGVLVAMAIYVIDTLFSASGVGITTHQSYAPMWQKLLAAFYGGIVEEILLRLFLMSLFVWISMKLSNQKQPTDVGIVISIFLAAIIFGLGHLPITASIATITPLVIIRAVVLNGIGGIAFGWLYWKKGIESAMIAHFTADIFLLTLLPLLFS